MNGITRPSSPDIRIFSLCRIRYQGSFFRNMNPISRFNAGWMYISSLLPFFAVERNPARNTPATKRKKRRRVTGSSPDRSVRCSYSLQVLPETNDN